MNTITGTKSLPPLACTRRTERPKPDRSCRRPVRRDCLDHEDAASEFQPFPTEGEMFDNLGLSKPELLARIGGLPGQVRSYKMVTVAFDEGRLLQTGSGPNVQGGILTLCTCRREIRAEKTADEWRGWWIAGVTSPKRQGGFWLFYLARVMAAYESQAGLWAALDHGEREAKCTRWNRVGDVYEPLPSARLRPFDASSYHPAMVGHRHRKTASDNKWKKDTEFFHKNFKRRAPCLVADPNLTFLWQTPRLFVEAHQRNETSDGVRAFIKKLKAGD